MIFWCDQKFAIRTPITNWDVIGVLGIIKVIFAVWIQRICPNIFTLEIVFQ
jgi:hypothetical protein